MMALIQSVIARAKGAVRSGRLTYALSLCLAILREIFDENAYRRFLARQNLTSSREAFATFQSEQSSSQRRRYRCC